MSFTSDDERKAVLTTNTSVLARRIWIDSEHTTLPYEAGWASEAVFFTQVEGPHPELTVTTEISPDGIIWVRHGRVGTLAEHETLVSNSVSVFGNWLRLRIEGASAERPARILVHLNLKG